jgi:serine/threonine-protein kinase
MTKPQLDAGASRLLAGRYQLLEELDSGGMASVWKGHDQVLGRDVAIKLLREDLAADAEFAARFRQEAVHAANLNHPGIVGVFDIGAHDGVPYIVMELVDGRTIRQLLAREGPLTPAQAARIALGIAQALAYAHRLGVTHRNLKPANIMLTQSGAVKVADFALARAVEGEDPDRTGELLGPPSGYVAPEQLAGGEADGRADLYALGVCLFEMLTGSTPGDADPSREAGASPKALRADVPDGLDEIVRKATASTPANRFAGAQELVTALRDQTGRPAPQPVPPPRPAPENTTEPLPPPPDPAPTPSFAATARPAGAPPPAPRPAAPRPRRPAAAYRSPWLGPIVAVVIVFAAIATLVGTGSLRPDPDAAAGDTTGPGSTAAQSRPIKTVVVGSINPTEPGGENPGREGRAVDGDANTSWATQEFHRAGFGNFKGGVGLIVAADGDTAPRRLDLRLARAGGRAKVYAADQPYGNRETVSPALPAAALEARLTELGWQEVAPEARLGTAASFELPEGTRRYLLVWVTEAPRLNAGEWKLEITEARLFS